MKYRLSKGDIQMLTIYAKDPFSENYLSVEAGEEYELKVDPKEKWKDLFKWCDANGFWNIFLLDKYKRVPGHKCFKLCGTIGKNEECHFPIGIHRKWIAESSGDVFFFPNDSNNLKRYDNNRKSIKLEVRRLE